MTCKSSLISLLMLAGTTTAATANDIAAPSEKCFPTDSIFDFAKKMDGLKDSRRDTLVTEMTAFFVNAKERAVPMTLYAKSGETRHDFAVTQDGEIADFYKTVTSMSPDTEVCGPTKEDGKIGLGMGSEVMFQNRSGRYTLAELQDGVADGKSHYKKMLPGPMAMFVPKMTHIMVEYDAEDAPADIRALINNAEVTDLPIAQFGKAYVLEVKALEARGVQTLIVNGGPHSLSPTPSIKKMKSLGFGPDDDND